MDAWRVLGPLTSLDPVEDCCNIVSAHKADQGTLLCYIAEDGEPIYTHVILWGLTGAGNVEPITMSGVWDGLSDHRQRMFVVHPSGRCENFEISWDDLDGALKTTREALAPKM
ncbi:MAG: hypothetical protein V4696_07540 [Pseudomonadota bacterium]